MASEILAVPEEDLREVIGIIRAGLVWRAGDVTPRVRDALRTWCAEEEEYLNQDVEEVDDGS